MPDALPAAFEWLGKRKVTPIVTIFVLALSGLHSFLILHEQASEREQQASERRQFLDMLTKERAHSTSAERKLQEATAALADATSRIEMRGSCVCTPCRRPQPCPKQEPCPVSDCIPCPPPPPAPKPILRVKPGDPRPW